MRRVLVIRLTAMGDVAMASLVVAAAASANPDVAFDVLTTPFFRPFFRQQPNVRFLGTDIRRERSGFTGLVRLVRQLRRDEVADPAERLNDKAFAYTDVVDLHDVIRSQVIRTLFGLRGCRVTSIDKGRAEKRRLVSGEERRQLAHSTQRYADTFRRAGLEVPEPFPTRPAEELPAALAKVCRGAHRESETWVGFSPFAQHIGKMYRIDRVHNVIRGLLAARPDARVFVFGGGIDEQASAQILTEREERCHNVVRVMTLADEMALMSRLDLMFSMDSSAQHICSLYGVPVLSVWGATHPYAGFLGYGQSPDSVVQRDDMPCRPCSIFGNKPCRLGRTPCLDIEPPVIVEKMLRMLPPKKG